MHELNFFNRLRFKFFHLTWISDNANGFYAMYRGYDFIVSAGPEGYVLSVWRRTDQLAVTDFAYTNAAEAKRACELIAFKSFHL